MRVKQLIFMCAVILLPLRLQADPIAVVSGNLTTQSFGSPMGLFTFITEDGSVFTGQFPGATHRCSPCVEGRVADVGGTFRYDATPFVGGDPFATGSAIIHGRTFPFLWFSGVLTFEASTVIPDFAAFPPPQSQRFEVTAPFTFSGTLSGFDRREEGPIHLSPLFTTNLTGAGTATVDLVGVEIGGRTSLSYLGTTYDFTAPTPEPPTLLLLTLSAAALARRKLRDIRRLHAP